MTGTSGLSEEPKISIVTTLRAPLHTTQDFVHFHLNSGVDHIFLYFDDPNDPAIQCLQDEPRLTCIACDEAFWRSTPKYVLRGSIRPYDEAYGAMKLVDRQLTNANHGLALARKKGGGWVAHIDSDELIFSTQELKLFLRRLPRTVNEVRLAVREALATEVSKDRRFSEFIWFKRPTAGSRLRLAQALGCKIIFEGEFFRGHTSSKCLIRADADVLSMGIHRPAFIDDSRCAVETAGHYLLHYDDLGLVNWKDKFGQRLDGALAASTMRDNRLKQLRLFEQARDAQPSEHDNIEELYSDLYVAGSVELGILRVLGMLQRIDIPQSLFRVVRRQQGNAA